MVVEEEVRVGNSYRRGLVVMVVVFRVGCFLGCVWF